MRCGCTCICLQVITIALDESEKSKVESGREMYYSDSRIAGEGMQIMRLIVSLFDVRIEQAVLQLVEGATWAGNSSRTREEEAQSVSKKPPLPHCALSHITILPSHTSFIFIARIKESLDFLEYYVLPSRFTKLLAASVRPY